MKKSISAILAVLVLVPALAACTPAAPTTTAGGTTTAAATVPVGLEMKLIPVAEAAGYVGKEGYTFLDIRKKADYDTSRIKGAISADMDASVQGDTAAGVATIKEVAKDLKGTVILVCYSGKRYAQVTTDALNEIGFDMSKVVTLEGGIKEFSAAKPELVEGK